MRIHLRGGDGGQHVYVFKRVHLCACMQVDREADKRNVDRRDEASEYCCAEVGKVTFCCSQLSRHLVFLPLSGPNALFRRPSADGEPYLDVVLAYLFLVP